jgi:hypothetical protein
LHYYARAGAKAKLAACLIVFYNIFFGYIISSLAGANIINIYGRKFIAHEIY